MEDPSWILSSIPGLNKKGKILILFCILVGSWTNLLPLPNLLQHNGLYSSKPESKSTLLSFFQFLFVSYLATVMIKVNNRVCGALSSTQCILLVGDQQLPQEVHPHLSLPPNITLTSQKPWVWGLLQVRLLKMSGFYWGSLRAGLREKQWARESRIGQHWSVIQNNNSLATPTGSCEELPIGVRGLAFKLLIDQ